MGVYPTGVQARRPGGVARARVGEERGVPRFSQVRHYFLSIGGIRVNPNLPRLVFGEEGINL